MVELDAGLKGKLGEIKTDDLFQDDATGVVHVLKKHIDTAIDQVAQIVAEHERKRFAGLAQAHATISKEVGMMQAQLSAASRVVEAAKEWEAIAQTGYGDIGFSLTKPELKLLDAVRALDSLSSTGEG